MGVEIERKFLLKGDGWRSLGVPVYCRQGYLSRFEQRTVRVRLKGEKGFLTVKGPNQGPTRLEYEYEIPGDDCRAILDHLAEKPLIEKYRYRIPYHGLIWEIDEFLGENQGLILAEVELISETQAIRLPDWIGREVTGDPRYYNTSLVERPFSRWGGNPLPAASLFITDPSE